MQFNEFNLNPLLVKAVEDLGFKEAMPIQQEVLPILLERRTDLVGLAQTGTGKTAAFGLPLLNNIDVDAKTTQAIVLCPTRELCNQISKDLRSYAKYMPEVKIAAIYGGAGMDTQIRDLAKKPQIIVATPGRLQDMIRRGKADLSHIEWCILDEADEMLDMGFQEDVDAILGFMPEERSIMLFSATMPVEVEKILNHYMKDPVTISIGKKNSGTANVRHNYYLIRADQRYLALKRLIDYYPHIYGIVFCRTKNETQEVADNLIHDGYSAAALHGDLSQVQRDLVMSHFRQRYMQILVATDVAARGIDVSDLTHIINYNLPDETAVYIHRSGRTGRADKTGICISLIHVKEKHKIKAIEKVLGQTIEKALVPTAKQICEKQLFNHIDRLENVDIMRDDIEDYLPIVFRKLSWLTREELITRVVALNFNRFLDYYKNAKDLNVDETRPEKKEKKEKKVYNDENLVRLYFGRGKRDHIKPNFIIGRINDVTETKDIEIGHIDMYDNFCFVAVDKDRAQFVIDCFADPDKNPDGIKVEMTTGEPAPKKSSDDRKRRRDDDRKDRHGKDRDRDRGKEQKRENHHDRGARRHEKNDRYGNSSDHDKKKKKRKSFDDDRPERKYRW